MPENEKHQPPRPLLDEVGLVASVVEVDEPGAIAGLVVSTDPVPGASVDVGTVVILYVAAPSTQIATDASSD